MVSGTAREYENLSVRPSEAVVRMDRIDAQLLSSKSAAPRDPEEVEAGDGAEFEDSRDEMADRPEGELAE